VKKAGNYSWGE